MEKDLDRFRNNNADNQNDPFGDDLGLGADFFNDQDVLPNNFDLPQAPSRLEPDESRSPRRSDVSVAGALLNVVSLTDQIKL